MKFVVQKINLLMLGIFLSIASLSAQNSFIKENLTDEQTKLIEEQRNLIKANREAFKASLSAKQLAILEDATLSKEERRNSLIMTFTEVQKKILQENKAKVNTLKQEFRSTLTKEQRQQIRTRTKNRNGEERNELRESVVRDRQKRKRNKGG